MTHQCWCVSLSTVPLRRTWHLNNHPDLITIINATRPLPNQMGYTISMLVCFLHESLATVSPWVIYNNFKVTLENLKIIHFYKKTNGGSTALYTHAMQNLYLLMLSLGMKKISLGQVHPWKMQGWVSNIYFLSQPFWYIQQPYVLLVLSICGPHT